MAWQLRQQGSPRSIPDLSLGQIVEGLRDGQWATTDEVKAPGEPAWTAIENHPQLAEIAEEVEAPPSRKHDEGTHLDMTALIDVCLVLLIFFILTTTYGAVVQKVVPLPAVKAESKNPRVVTAKDVKERMIRLQVYQDAASKPVLRLENQPIQVLAADGKTVDQDLLTRAIRPYVQGEIRKTEMLLDASEVSWGMVIAIQDAAKGAGVHTIHYLKK
ncbi:MAG: biopolymer transporter ExbD [Planctomycetes bacterium]|nr:biopolymer transporter ExbD [Planctomycetota bacterium]